MARVEEYPQLVQDVLKRYGDFRPVYGDVEVQLSFDTVRHHYQLLTVGWNGYKRVRGCIIHVDIKDGKIWIQHDGTEDGIANVLVEMGVPKSDIVLAFHVPSKRPYTDFAVG